MHAIYKYPLAVTDEQILDMPEGAKVLSVQWQNGGLVAWALVRPGIEITKRVFRIFGTGNHMDAPKMKFVGTVQEPDRGLVWHVFTGALPAPPQS